MKRRFFCILISLTLMCFATACNKLNSSQNSDTAKAETGTDIEESPEINSTVHYVNVNIGDKTFTVMLYDNSSAKAFSELLPLDLNMNELNGNEKYFYLPDDLPTDNKNVSKINEGDFMLYGSNCLVLFYKSFSTEYSYTPLGRIDNPDGLYAALGDGDVQVRFTK